MARVSPLLVCVCVVFVSCGAAERQYFPQGTPMKWTDARSHCRSCFKELVTVTPENTQIIARNLSSDYWVGLRKRAVAFPDSAPFKDTPFWSLWANGDPLTFQNWYPGYPRAKPSVPVVDCSTCSCTCPASPAPPPTTSTTQKLMAFNASDHATPAQSTSTTATSTSAGTDYSTPGTDGVRQIIGVTQSSTSSAPPSESVCVNRLGSDSRAAPEPDEPYLEDPCVAVRSFGAWVEKDCEEHLSFICYEDRFYGEVNVTDIKADRATLTWARGPGQIQGYRVEVNNTYRDNVSDLTVVVDDLSAGTLYSIQVFPRKCERDLNPQNATFYTVPNKVSDLKVTEVTETCVYLNWSAPAGQVDLYLITGASQETNVTNTQGHVCNLTSGNLYKFSVQSGVSDRSQWSEKLDISAYTKPAKVSNLRTEDITDTKLTLKWDKPEGQATGYFIVWSYYKGGTVSQNKVVTETTLPIHDLPSGTKITLNVAALANQTLKGASQTVFNFTSPKKISNLTLRSTADTINATWEYPAGSPNFTVVLELENKEREKREYIHKPAVLFENLNGAANYTVKVSSVSGGTPSEEVSASIFTLPVPPRDPKLAEHNRTHLTFTWLPPPRTERVGYVVKLNSSFWGFHEEVVLDNETTHTFGGLKSGTNFTFEVQTTAGDVSHRSEVRSIRASTDPVLKELTLATVCSSSQDMLCNANETRQSAFEELLSHFKSLLGDHVVWSLKPANLTAGNT